MLNNIYYLSNYRNAKNRKIGVCALVIQDDKIVSIPEIPGPHMPFCEVNDDESIEEVCLKTLKEQAGISGKIVRHVYSGLVAHHFVTCYLVQADEVLKSDKGESIRLCNPVELITGPFHEYNKKVFDCLDISY